MEDAAGVSDDGVCWQAGSSIDRGVSCCYIVADLIVL